jgi:hypothetical protein
VITSGLARSTAIAPAIGFLDLPAKHRRVDDILDLVAQPPKQVDEPAGVEGVRGTLAIAPTEAFELAVRQMETIHRDEHG